MIKIRSPKLYLNPSLLKKAIFIAIYRRNAVRLNQTPNKLKVKLKLL